MTSLAEVKVGDSIRVTTSGMGRSSDRIATVERVTKTQVICDDGNRLNKSTGYRVGSTGAWGYVYGVIATEAEVERITAEVKMRDRIFQATRAMDAIRINSKTIDAFEALILTVADAAKANQVSA